MLQVLVIFLTLNSQAYNKEVIFSVILQIFTFCRIDTLSNFQTLIPQFRGGRKKDDFHHFHFLPFLSTTKQKNFAFVWKKCLSCLKGHCHIPFLNAFSVLQCICTFAAYLCWPKLQRNVKKTYQNGPKIHACHTTTYKHFLCRYIQLITR